MSMPPHQIQPIRPGSSLYYALLYSSSKERDAVAVLLSFFNEIEAIVNTISETSVAKAKLAWWSTEIRQVYKHYPQHPLSFSIDKLLQQFQLPESEFQRFIEAKSQAVDNPFITYQDYGAKLFLIACVTSNALPNERFIYHLSITLQSIDEIRYFGKKKHHQDKEVDLQTKAEHARANYLQALNHLNETERFAQLSLLILAKLYVTLLEEIERAKFDVLDQKISLTPLRKFWIAWRTKVHEKKRYHTHLKLKI